MATALAGDISGKGAYDPEDNLLLFPDGAGNVEVLNATNYQLQHLIPLYGVGPIFHTDGATYSVVNVATRTLTEQVELVKFDPVSASASGRVLLPTNDCGGYPLGNIPEIAASDANIYVPYFFSPGACQQAGVAVVDASSITLLNYLPFNVFSINGFAAESTSTVGYLAVTVTPVKHQILKMDFQSGAILWRHRVALLGSRSGPQSESGKRRWHRGTLDTGRAPASEVLRRLRTQRGH